MMALNLPLITWSIIVIAMTIFITVQLFNKDHKSMTSDRQTKPVHEFGKENK